MKRKIIGQKDSFTVTLPKKWVSEKGLKSGDEIDLELESSGNLLIKSELAKPQVINRYTIDIDGMNKYQINRLIRGLYRSKVDEIILKFQNTEISDRKKKKKVDLFEFCQEMTTKLIGLEITHKDQKSVVFQCFISREDEQKINIIEKRIFFLIKEFMDDILKNIDDFSRFYNKIYDVHDNISKFCEYYMRIIVNSCLPIEKKTANYSLVSLLDKLVDFLRYLSDEINRQGKVTKRVKNYLEELFSLFDIHYKFLFSIGGIKSNDLTKIRYDLLHKLQSEKLSLNEQKIITEAYILLHLMNDFHEVKRINSIVIEEVNRFTMH